MTAKRLSQADIHAQSNLRDFTLNQFANELEEEFKQYRHERLLKRVPIVGLGAIILFIIFAILDVFILPDAAYLITTSIRVFLIIPLIVVAIVASRLNWHISVFSWYYLSAYILAGWGIIAIIYTARVNGFALPYDGVLLHLVFGYFLMGMPYTLAAFGGICITVGYLAIELTLHTPSDQLASNMLFILTLNVMGYMGSFMQERSRRQLFLNMKLVDFAKLKDEKEIEAKTKLIATASHDLRQPLHAMNILVEALYNDLPEGETKSLSQKLKESLRQLGQLLTSLLDISRFNAGIVEYSPVNIELSKQIETLLHNQKIRAQELGITLKTRGPSPCFVKTDPVLLERIFRNLCENVYEHADATEITIDWQLIDKQIRLSIQDNGKGIEETDRDAIFEEFHRSLEGKKNGMGLGLAIVKQSCEKMGCDFGVESQLGQGATFWLSLEASHIIDTPDISNRSASLSVNSTHIMLVDNDLTQLDSLAKLIDSWGYTTATSSCLELALTKVRSGQFNLVITSLSLEGDHLAGLTLIKTLREEFNPNLRAIIITNLSEADAPEELSEFLLQDADITELALKPVPPAKLRLMIQHFMRSIQ